MIVYLENAQEIVTLPESLLTSIEQAMTVLSQQENLAANTEIDIQIVSDEEIHQLNKEYRKVDRPTDVLSFALDEGEEEPELTAEAEHLLGDIVISAETALRQSEEYGHGLRREIVYLSVHGALHLLGYDHMEEEDKVVMRKREEEVLRELKLSEEFLSSREDKGQAELVQAALAAKERAYAPYSLFHVGAAVRTAEGLIFTGCNIENASYGASNCGERSAIFNAVSAGQRNISELCVVSDSEDYCAPCGICRQVMREFNISKIYLANCKGEVKETSLAELLPYSFGPEWLEKKA